VDVNERTVRELSEAADLPIGQERLAPIAHQLGEWLEAANELSRKLAASEHQAIVPIAVFRHPIREGKEE
jgi:hypothetical protein